MFSAAGDDGSGIPSTGIASQLTPSHQHLLQIARDEDNQKHRDFYKWLANSARFPESQTLGFLSHHIQQHLRLRNNSLRSSG